MIERNWSDERGFSFPFFISFYRLLFSSFFFYWADSGVTSVRLLVGVWWGVKSSMKRNSPEWVDHRAAAAHKSNHSPPPERIWWWKKKLIIIKLKFIAHLSRKLNGKNESRQKLCRERDDEESKFNIFLFDLISYLSVAALGGSRVIWVSDSQKKGLWNSTIITSTTIWHFVSILSTLSTRHTPGRERERERAIQ